MLVVVAGIVAVVSLFGALAYWAYKKDQQRIASVMALCASNGWQFHAKDPYDLPHRWPGTPFDCGYDRTARNVVTGEAGGRPMVAFDYSYKEDSTDSKGNRSTSTYHFAILALAMPCALPELHLGPEGVFSRLGNVLGMQDIELESEDFNRRFRVRCPDPKLASDVLTPRTMEMLLAAGKIRFRFVGADAVSYASGLLRPVEMLRAAHVLANVVDGIPAFVWHDHGVEAPSPGSAT